MTAFELDNYDNYVPRSKEIEFACEAKLSLKEKNVKSKDNQLESKEETKESSDCDLEFLKLYLQRSILGVEESTKVKSL